MVGTRSTLNVPAAAVHRSCKTCGIDDVSNMQCDKCKEFYHPRCLLLIASMNVAPDSKIYCCNNNSNGDMLLYKKLCEEMESKNKILIEYKDTLLDKISSLENEIARRCASSSELTSTTKRQEEISASVHSEVVNELMERNKRSSNVIIYGFVESVGSKQEQVQKDINFVNSILHELDVNATFDAPIRLGKWDPTKQNLARPLNLRLQSSSIAESVLKSSRKLKSKEQWASFTIAQDSNV